MATILDGMNGGKHNSDNTEHVDNMQTYSVSLTFTFCLVIDRSLESIS